MAKPIKADYRKETFFMIEASEIDDLIMKKFKKDFNTAYALEGARLYKQYVCASEDDSEDETSKDWSHENLESFLSILCREKILEEGWYLIAFDD